MNIIRTELQVALHDLHVAVQESADHYRDSAEFLDDEPVSQLLVEIADEREQLAQKFEQAIRATDDLPAAPDADRETGEQLIHRLRSLFSSDQTEDVLNQRLEAEDALAQMLTDAREAELGAEYEALRQAFADQVRSARTRLEKAKA